MRTIRSLSQLLLSLALPSLLWACTPTSTPVSSESPAPPAPDTAAADAVGELEIRANGEDFVRQGFETKDGWQINFDQLYVTLAAVTAYQSDSPFDAEAGGLPIAQTTVTLEDPVTVDLAAGEATADPIRVGTVTAPAGRYNALSWKMVPAPAAPALGQTLWMQGTATKGDRRIDFTIKLDPTLGFVCGDYVGDDRKGFLEAGGRADLEATFHFDHLFGDGEAPPEDEINTGALGFDPLAAIAAGNTLEIDRAGLAAQLSPGDYDRLLGILSNLGHVGEGHCEETELARS
ncbi:MAG: DUF4382 domain-containing protein [Prochlorotrichaceae cyanobacterium]